MESKTNSSISVSGTNGSTSDLPSSTMRRRTFLASASSGSALAALSGCLGASEGNVRPETNPDDVPVEFACDDDALERYPTGYESVDLRWGDTGSASLRVEDLSYEYGDTTEITLAAPVRGNADKWNVEVYTERGWIEVRTVEAGRRLSTTDEDVEGGHTWNLGLTEDGIVEASRNPDRVRVCPDLVSGRYRFVYHGLIDGETGEVGSVAVSFDVEV